MENEIWKDVPGYEGYYQASTLGRIKSLSRSVKCRGNNLKTNKEKVLRQSNNKGYLLVVLSKKGKISPKSVHQIIAMTFLNHKPCGFKLVVNHINFKKYDNRLINLELITSRNNTNRKHLKSTSKYTGVGFCSARNKWKSYIHINSVTRHLGYFKKEIDASIAYEDALMLHINNKSIQTIINKNKPKFSSKYRGVSWIKKDKIWKAVIWHDGNGVLLGRFKNEKEAHIAYLKAKTLLNKTK